jgi:UDP-GlcNAc3NAcA epimerase
MNIATVLGARPQFVKAAPVSGALRRAGHTERLIHTGQHYDHAMSQVFFDELGMSEPAVNLGVGSGPHGRQTAEMLAGIEDVLTGWRPHKVLVYGDTNSTLAGALAACKLRIPVAHVEAGLRSFNTEMPEEHNRVLTDHCSDLLLCPTATAVENLRREGITEGVFQVGDTMYDAVLAWGKAARERSAILNELALRPRSYALATVHRPYNTDNPQILADILAGLSEANEPIVFPVHPRTRSALSGLQVPSNVRTIEPLGYLDMLMLEQNARVILTDSGGVQKEAYFFGVPCITLRPETEWLETVDAGWNVVAGHDHARIAAALARFRPPTGEPPRVFGCGDAAARIVDVVTTCG